MNRFCPRCGKEGTPENFVRGFCSACYSMEHAIVSVPRVIPVEHCKRCGKVRLHGSWEEQEEEALRALAAASVKSKDLSEPRIGVELEPSEQGATVARVSISGKIDGSDVNVEKEILLRPQGALCDACMKLASDYYEATIQLRFEGRPLQAEIKERLQELEDALRPILREDALAVVVAVKKVQRGIDVLIGSKRAAKLAAEALAKKTGGKAKRSYSLVGVDKSGKPKTRQTYCVRFG
ncbi:MAG: NMD3-related protein [Candidatus Diapherotrites archaeon]